MDILVCDDDPAIASFMQSRFEIEGWSVRLTSTGEECLAAIESGDDPDVLVLDQEMPGLKGTQVAGQLRDGGFAKPIVLCSAYLSGEVNDERERLDLIAMSKIDMERVVRRVELISEDSNLVGTGVSMATRPRVSA